jgi:indolepyruvate decarboxylase
MNTTTTTTTAATGANTNAATDTTTVAAYLIARLQQAGLEHMFAVPGDYASPFLLALDATPGIVRVPTIAELGSGYAADGYARFRGIGAACVQYGVGTFSLLACAAGSFVERVPVAIISASPSTSDRVLERTKQILFHHSTGDLRADQIVFKNVTVASEIIQGAETAPAQIDRAIVAMLTHRRPIYIEVLNNVWTQTCAAPHGTLQAEIVASDPHALAAVVDAAWRRIAAARLPVLWLGVEIQRFGLQDAAQGLVDAGFPFTTTSLGKTVLDESQRHFIGTYAGPASPALTRAVMAATDCPIALGTIITDDYLDIMKSKFVEMIEVNDEEARVGYEYYHGVTLKDFVDALLARARREAHGPRAYALPHADPELPTAAATDDALSYNVFFDEIGAYLARDERRRSEIVLVLGESTSLYVFGNLFGLPANAFVANAAWGSLGHETGCALGVALGSGKRPFVVAGDGGFMMTCQELSSLARHQCNAVIFVMSNQAYAIEQAFVDINAFTPTGTFAPFDLLPAWDYLSLARAFGASGYRAQTVGELRDVLSALDSLQSVPALVEILIPQKDLAPQLKRLAETPAPKRKYGRAALTPSS